MGQTLSSSPSRCFSQGARPPARVGFDSSGAFQKALLLLFPATPTPFTSFNSFPSYANVDLASCMGSLKNRPGGTFIQSTRALARLGFGEADVFLEAFSLLFLTVPTPFTSSNSFPTTLYGPYGIFYVEPTYQSLSAKKNRR